MIRYTETDAASEVRRLTGGQCVAVVYDGVGHSSFGASLDCLRTREELLSRASTIFGWVAAGQLMVRIGARYPFSEASRAHEDLEGRRTTGKSLLVPA